jgi:hypothetical protein
MNKMGIYQYIGATGMDNNDSFIIKDPTMDQLNQFAKSNQHGTVFHTGQMVQVFKESLDMDVIKLAAVDQKTDDINSILVLPIRRLPKMPKKMFFGVSRVTNPLFILENERSIFSAGKLLDEYEKISKKNIVYTKIRMTFEKSKKDKDNWANRNYSYEGFDNFIIDLSKGETEVWNGISTSPKRRIKQSEHKVGLNAEFSKDSKDITIFYNLLRSTYERSNIQMPDISHFKSIYTNLCENDLAKLILIDYDGIKVAGRLVLTYKDTIYDWYAGSNYDYPKIPANQYAVWSTLKWGIENNYKYFDFGGNGNPNEYLGFREFKRSFGGAYLDYGIYIKIHKPYYYKIIEMGKQIVKYRKKKDK